MNPFQSPPGEKIRTVAALVGAGLVMALPVAAAAAQDQPLAALTASAVLGVALVWGLRQQVLRRLCSGLELQRAERLRFETAIDNISQGLCFFDAQQRLIVCNRRYPEMYGLSPDLVRPGTTLREILGHRLRAGSIPDMSTDQYLAWQQSFAVSDKVSDFVSELKDGRVFAIHYEPMPDGGYVATHEDITEARRAQAQIEQMARSDSLTKLPNRMHFRERLNSALVLTRESTSVAVLYVDLDRFKAVNDTFGHPVGDQLLCAAAQRMSHCVRQTDLVARLGGDEFAIIQISASQPLAATALASRLVQAFHEPFEIDGHDVQVGASVGVALAPAVTISDDIGLEALLQSADLALYAAKAAGRGTHRLFRPSVTARLSHQLGGAHVPAVQIPADSAH